MNNEINLAKPSIHLNGSSPDHLFEVYQTAHTALKAALEVIAATAPNGRDYYPQGPEMINIATREHLRRLERVEAVAMEFEVLVGHVRAEIAARKRR